MIVVAAVIVFDSGFIFTVDVTFQVLVVVVVDQ